MEIALIRDGKDICVTDIELSEASSAAAILLGAAATASDQMPPQNSLPVISIVPTGLAFGPSHIPNCDNLVLFFGFSALGIAIPRENMAAIGQQLIALGTMGTAH
jgi:hypothetical protein